MVVPACRQYGRRHPDARLGVWNAVFGLLLFLLDSPYGVAGEGDGAWLPVKDTDLRIVAGSALDFSTLVAPLDVTRPVTLDSGTIRAQGGARERYFCAPLTYPFLYGLFPDRAEAQAIARQLRRMGYNLARLHFVDATLMASAREDFAFDPEQVDRFHYFLFALKQQGIRWMIDAATSWNGAYYAGKKHFARGRYNLKRDIHFDKTAQNHWKELVRRLLYVPNKYTEHRIIDDPALAVLTLFNEIGIQFNANRDRRYAEELQEPFKQWQAAQGFAKPLELPGRYEVSQRAARMNAFITSREKATYDWMVSFVRGLGFRGLITAYNNGKSLQATAARAFTDVVSLHAYHDAPSNFIRKGSEQTAASSIDDNLGYVNYFALNRYLGKPYIIDEYDHPYWNPWRREASLIMSSAAALQDWDGLCRFRNPAVLEYSTGKAPRHDAIHPMDIGMDPVARASETVAALLYGRKDLASSEYLLRIVPGEAFHSAQAARIADSGLLDGQVLVSKLGLDGAFEHAIADDHARAVADIPLPFDKASTARARRALELYRADKRIGTAAEEKTAPKLGVDDSRFDFASDTGQIFVNKRHRFFGAISAKTEAVSWDGSVDVSMNRVAIRETGVPMLIALSSLTGESLGDSKRLLLVMATDAVNSGARFARGREKLVELGSLPVLLRSATARMRISRDVPVAPSAYALALNGERREEVPVRVTKNTLFLDIALDKLKDGPTLYFELVFPAVDALGSKAG